MKRMIDADRLLEVLRYNRQHKDELGNTYQMTAVDIDALIRFIENELIDNLFSLSPFRR